MMNEALKAQFSRLSGYFNKDLTTDQYREYENKLKFIPAKALSEIVDAIIDERRPTPGAFPTPSRIRKMWYVWQKQNDHRAAQAHEYPPCDECNSSGLFWFFEHDEVLGYSVCRIAACRSCQNWKKHFSDPERLTFANKNQLINAGKRIWQPDPTKEIS